MCFESSSQSPHFWASVSICFCQTSTAGTLLGWGATGFCDTLPLEGGGALLPGGVCGCCAACGKALPLITTTANSNAKNSLAIRYLQYSGQISTARPMRQMHPRCSERSTAQSTGAVATLIYRID